MIGTGSIDIKGIVAAGAAAGVEIHYLEDESPDVLTQVPQSVGLYQWTLGHRPRARAERIHSA